MLALSRNYGGARSPWRKTNKEMTMTLGAIIQSLAFAIVFIPINGLLIMLATKILKLKNQRYRTAISLAAITGGVSFLFGVLGILIKHEFIIAFVSFILVSILLKGWLLTRFYRLDLGKAALVWLVWFGLTIAAGMVIGLLFFVLAMVVGMMVGFSALGNV